MKVHDLLQLHKLSLEVDSTFSLIKEPLIYLDGFSVAPRYPDEFEEYEIEDGIHAIKSVEIVREFCRIVLHLKNV